MNYLAQLLTWIWLSGPLHRLANAATPNSTSQICSGAGIDCSGGVNGNGQVVNSSGQVPGNLTGQTVVIINTLLYVAGGVAILIIVLGGIRYVTSTGDATRVKQAKDTILYAIFGLVIAILAFAIVNFVANRIS